MTIVMSGRATPLVRLNTARTDGTRMPFDRAVDGTVVGDRIHARSCRRIDQLRDPAEAVEEAEFGVDVEMHEVIGAIVIGCQKVPARAA